MSVDVKSTLELLHEKDAELKELYAIQNDAWKQEERLKRLNSQLDERIQTIEREIHKLVTVRQEEIHHERNLRNKGVVRRAMYGSNN